MLAMLLNVLTYEFTWKLLKYICKLLYLLLFMVQLTIYFV